MRAALLAVAAVLFSAAPSLAADPPIVFQMQPAGRVLDELRTAAGFVGGENAVKLVNKALKEAFGEKGLEGFDINRPVVGYVILAPKPEDITAVVALPITGEKEFLDLCDRLNKDKLTVDPKDKTLYHLPPLNPRYKAMMRFSNQYAYIAYGYNPAPHIEAKALVAMPDLYDANERGLIAGRIHFDRIPADVRKAAPRLFEEVKNTLFARPGGVAPIGIGQQEMKLLAPMGAELEKLLARYIKLSEGGDTLTARIYLDSQAGNFVTEAVLTGKPGSDLSKIIAARKPTTNKFAALTAHPDTAVGFKMRLPLFEDEIKSAVALGLDAVGKDAVQNVPEVSKPVIGELFKGLTRTVKTGEFDIVAAVRGPDKDGWFTAVGALAFEDPAALEKEFKKYVEKDAPQDVVDAIKWDAAKAGNVNIHTWTIKQGGFIDVTRVFGGADCVFAFAFAPHGVFGAMGPDAVNVLKDALAVKPANSPVLDVVVNPARVRKLIAKTNVERPEDAKIEAIFGKEDKLGSVLSLTVDGGQQLTAKFTLDLRVLPRLMFQRDIERAAARDTDAKIEEKPQVDPEPIKK